MIIDAGQKEFGAKQCQACGVVFELGNPSDETSHREYHDHLFTALKYTVSTRLRTLQNLGNISKTLPHCVMDLLHHYLPVHHQESRPWPRTCICVMKNV